MQRQELHDHILNPTISKPHLVLMILNRERNLLAMTIYTIGCSKKMCISNNLIYDHIYTYIYIYVYINSPEVWNESDDVITDIEPPNT